MYQKTAGFCIARPPGAAETFLWQMNEVGDYRDVGFRTVLYLLAKLLYRTNVSRSAEVKQAKTSLEEYHKWRRRSVDLVLSAADRYAVVIQDKVVLDFGCSDGVMTSEYASRGGAREVVGVDINEAAINRARTLNVPSNVSFRVSGPDSIPAPDESFDVIVSNDVFEHVSKPGPLLDECYRILKPSGQMLIGTWGWYHPFAPHLAATMPVPWAHVFFSEKTVIRVCRRVYNSAWYIPTMHDFDEQGNRKEKFTKEEISSEYLNKLLVRDFEDLFRRSRFDFGLYPQPFGSKAARWTRVFLKTPLIREFVTAFFWAVLSKS